MSRLALPLVVIIALPAALLVAAGLPLSFPAGAQPVETGDEDHTWAPAPRGEHACLPATVRVPAALLSGPAAAGHGSSTADGAACTAPVGVPSTARVGTAEARAAVARTRRTLLRPLAPRAP